MINGGSEAGECCFFMHVSSASMGCQGGASSCCMPRCPNLTLVLADVGTGFTPESMEERTDRKKKEMPPQKQPRKLLSYADISTLHNVGESCFLNL